MTSTFLFQNRKMTHRIRRHQSLLLPVLFLILQARAIPALAAAPAIRVEGSPRPGNVLFVSLTGASRHGQATGSWGQRRIVFYPDRRGILHALVPVPRDAKPGDYLLEIDTSGPEGNHSISHTIRILPRHFASQSIWLPRYEAQRYNSPEVNAEYDLIDRALATISRSLFPRLPLDRPVNAPITTLFGVARFVNGKPNGWHRGVDFGAGTGTPIYAPAAGRVVLARKGLMLHGNVIVLDHGYGLHTLYIHLNRIKVKQGEEVRRGQEIGTVGMTGNATGPNLHWGVYLYGLPVDPLVLLRRPPAGWPER